VGLGLFQEAACAQENNDIKDRLLVEWASIAAQAGSLSFERTIEHYWSRDGKPLALTSTSATRAEFNARGRLVFGEQEDVDEETGLKTKLLQFKICNQRYCAKLARAKKDDSWLLSELTSAEKVEESDRFRYMYCCPWLSCNSGWLPRWLADACFVLQTVEEKDDDVGRRFLRISFLNDETKRKSAPFPGVVSGYIDVEPAHSHRLLAYDFKTKDKVSEGREQATFEYEPGKGLPVLKKKIIEWPINTGKFGIGKGKEIQTYKMEFGATVADERFRLSYYGLPEPVGVAWKKPVPIYVWFLLGAGGCIAAATILRYAARRRRTAGV
jgi:hypothetical protein